MPRVNANHVVFLLGLVLSVCVYSLLAKFEVPVRIAWGSAILSILVVAIFWSAVNLTDDEEDEE